MQLLSDIKFPAMIIASPRTGSNLLTNYIKLKYDTVSFLEPNRQIDQRQIAYNKSYRPTVDDVLAYDKQSSNYVIKVHGKDFFHLELQYDSFDLSKYYLIRIRRRDFVSRILSYYTASLRGIWSYDINNMVYIDTPIDIDIEKIRKIIRYLVATNYLIDNFEYHMNIKFASDIYYEDLIILPSIMDGSGTHMVKTPKPTNYDEVKSIIQTELHLHLHK